MAALFADAQVHPAAIDHAEVERIARELLIALGQDVNRDGLRDTPMRFAHWWKDFFNYDPGKLDTAFDMVSTGQMVAVSGVRVWSLCEHHLLPFWCDIKVGYYPKDKIIGLSKFARIAHHYAHQLQVQERLTDQIANHIQEVTGSPDVIVVGQGEHLCMTMRGIRTPALMSSIVTRGAFTQPEVQRLFFELTTSRK